MMKEEGRFLGSEEVRKGNAIGGCRMQVTPVGQEQHRDEMVERYVASCGGCVFSNVALSVPAGDFSALVEKAAAHAEIFCGQWILRGKNQEFPLWFFITPPQTS